MITLKILTGSEAELLGSIDRSDISTDWLDTPEEILAHTRYCIEHGLCGHTFAIEADGRTVGVILMGQGIPWSVDPPELKGVPFYRIMHFYLDRAWRDKGIGGRAFDLCIQRIYKEYGARPILIGCQEENTGAMEFYLRRGFKSSGCYDEDDLFLIRWP